MTENSNQPRDFDAVLGGQTPAPFGGVVLGGLEGVKKRFSSEFVEQRVAAVKDATRYKHSGLKIAIQALSDESEQVRQVAYVLLRERADPEVSKALQSFNFYRFFDCIRTLKAGEKTAIGADGQAIAYLRGKTIRVCNLHSDELYYTVDKYPKAQESFIISKDGETLVRSINGSSNFVEIWQMGEKIDDGCYGHEDRIEAIAISPNVGALPETSPLLATGSYDKTIKIWSLETGKLLFTISSLLTWKTHKQAVLCLAFSPDGQMLASGSADNTIKLWNLRTRNLICTFKLPYYGGVQSVIIGSDGKTIASASSDRKIRLWHLGIEEAIRTLDDDSGWVNCLAFSPNGRILASGNSQKAIAIWNIYTGELLHTLTGHENSVTCLAFSWDGQTLVSGSEDKTIKVWGVP